MGIQLKPHQLDALERMKNGCILNGDVGSGKSLVSLCYYTKINGGRACDGPYIKMNNPCDLYIITTARKRDTYEWDAELNRIYMSVIPGSGLYPNVKVVVDSWNNAHKYTDVKNAFFIFDEQRLVGYGQWVKSFFKIAEKNKWILLTATPGDTWLDYMPIFIANGFYKNKTDFVHQHVVWCSFIDFPRVDRYLNEGRLMRYKNDILVTMEFERHTVQHHDQIHCKYDPVMYSMVQKDRWNPYENAPIDNASEYCSCLRKVVNSDSSRVVAIADILKEHEKAIIFYNYDYELNILRDLFSSTNYPYTEWNGHKHEKIEEGDKWVYLVQYAAGNEGWNCITCDTEIFYSPSYSYKTMVQACGRIDRMNTPYTDLYYYHLTSDSSIDRAINRTLNRKKKFNEKGFAPKFDSRKETSMPLGGTYENAYGNKHGC